MIHHVPIAEVDRVTAISETTVAVARAGRINADGKVPVAALGVHPGVLRLQVSRSTIRQTCVPQIVPSGAGLRISMTT